MVPKHSCLYITSSNCTIVRRLRSLYWSSVFQVNGEGNCVWYNNICLTQWPPSTPTRFTCFVTAMGQSASAMTPFNWYVRVHNGSLCLMATEYTDSVLFALWPQWVRVRVAMTPFNWYVRVHNGWVIVLNGQRVQRLVSFDGMILFDWVWEIVTFDWVKWLVSFDWVVSFLRLVPAAIW